MYLLRFRNDVQGRALLQSTREPVGDVHVEFSEGWRTIKASKWMPGNIRYWLEKDLGAPVKNCTRAIGDFDFDLRWKAGDIASVNQALAAYGLEVVSEDEETTQ
jgi:hypothetical protein